jgi:hypothetical protein
MYSLITVLSQISPIYEKMSETHSDVAFGKVDVDNNSDSAMDFKVRRYFMR